MSGSGLNQYEDRYMDWEQSIDGRSYTATTTGYQVMIWKTTSGEWTALVSEHTQDVAHRRFTRLNDAKAWCEEHVAPFLPPIPASTTANRGRKGYVLWTPTAPGNTTQVRTST
jgi:hypothetical protein